MGWLATQSVSLVDEVLVSYVQFLYDGKRAYTHAPCPLAAIQHYHRALHGQRRPAWQSVKIWKRASHASYEHQFRCVSLGVSLWWL